MASFPNNVNTDDIDEALLIEELKDHEANNNEGVMRTPGCHTWSTAWSPDGSLFAWSCGHRIVKLIPWDKRRNRSQVLDTELGENYRSFDCGEIVWSLAFGSSSAERKPFSIEINFHHLHIINDMIMATGLTSGRIRIWDIKTGKLMSELVDHTKEILSLKFSPDGSLILVSASRDGSLKVWDMNDDGNMTKTLRCNGCSCFNSVAWSPNAKTIVAVGQNKTVAIFDMSDYKKPVLKNQLKGHHNNVLGCDFSPDGALIATASYDTRVLLFDAFTYDVLKEFCHAYPPPRLIYASGANDNYVRGVSFSQDGIHVATVCDDQYVRIWNIFDEFVPEKVFKVENALCCGYNASGSVLAVGTKQGTVSLLAAAPTVESLEHICRLVVRRNVANSSKVDFLQIPIKMKEFLKYHY